MLDITKSERYIILSILFTATLLLAFSYGQKIISIGEFETIELNILPQIINVNTAAPAELERLPGIGPVLAEEIILYRQRSGGFKNIEEIKNVKGIGDKKFEKIKDLISTSE